MANFIIVDKRPGGDKGIISIALAGETSEIWEVIGDSIHYTTEDVRQSGIFPPVYESYHEQNSRLLLMPIEIEKDEAAPERFICTLKWTSEPLTPSQKEDQDDNPLDRKARVKIRTIREKEVRHRDFYGKPKQNAAGDLFDPPIESNTAFLQIMIRKNVEVFPDWVFDFIDSVNSEPVTIKGRTFPARRICVADISLDEEKEDGSTVYCEASIELHVKKPRKPVDSEDPEDVPSPWQTEQLNEGLHELVEKYPGTPSTDKIHRRISVPSIDEVGTVTYQPAASPVMLNDTGGKLDPVTIDNATFIVFDDHEYLDLNDISFLWSNA